MAVAEAIQRCTDGVDGDLDGFTDCDDWDCQWHPLLNPSATMATDVAPGLCQNGRFDRNVPGFWRAPEEGERPSRGTDADPNPAPTPLLCR